MSTQAWFGVPIYVDQAEGKLFKDIQREIRSVYKELKFEQVWDGNTHELNKDPFADSIIDRMPVFSKHLDKQIKSYLNELRHPGEEYKVFPSWLTKTVKDKYAHQHDHGSSDLSGVYYFKTTGEDGSLYFVSPHRSLSSNFIFNLVNNEQELTPNEGLLALWPGMIRHGTRTNKTEHTRVSLSFNIQFRRKGFDWPAYTHER